jgi:cyclic pyranopterin monophosphate synthase
MSGDSTQDENGPVTLLTVPNQTEAAIIAHQLETYGIETSTTGDFIAGFRAEAPGNVQILVRAGDLREAQRVLAEIRNDQGREERPLPTEKPAGPLSHFDRYGASRMVDVGDKPITRRIARASGSVRMALATREKIMDRKLSKGDVLEVARLAGIMAAKQTADLIPLCHPLSLDSVSISFQNVGDELIHIESTIQVDAKTGVEMEALVAVSVTALTIIDMCKSIDRKISIEQIRLEEKSGGASGHFLR